MNNGTANAGQGKEKLLHLRGISIDPQRKGFNIEDAGEYPSGIQPDEIRKFIAENFVSIQVEGKAKGKADKQTDKESGR